VDREIPSLDGRRFRAAANAPGGQVTEQTEFSFSQDGDLVFARYSGGAIRLGYLLGVRRGMQAKIRYVHVDLGGVIRSGRSRETIEVLADGRLRIHEEWQWESEPGCSGTSVLEETVGGDDVKGRVFE
jgi:hypothetical protein